MKKIRVLGIAGSLREGSYNRALLRAAREMAPEEMEITIFERLGEIPLYNEDLRAQGDPEAVAALKRAIAAADALLIATPEYNHSIPGVLKNAIDWASRPPGESPLDGKPAAIMGASSGSFGTARAQMHLRQAFVFTNVLVLNRPGVLVARARDKFGEQGQLEDERTRHYLGRLLEALVEWTRRVKEGE